MFLCSQEGSFMAYEMTIRLTDEEYAALTAEAAKSGKPPEMVLHDLMRQQLKPAQPPPTLTDHELAEQLYREGALLHLATRKPLTPEEQAERARLAQVFAGGKPLSEMILEDRGPY
jgi:hypothetical protein